MKKITNLVKTFFADEKGAETVEWVMIAAVLAGIITAVFWNTLQGGLNTGIGNINNAIANPTAG
jgi:Flp pilus assembly pilin Flp